MHCFTDGQVILYILSSSKSGLTSHINLKYHGVQASLERVVENRLNSLTEDVGPLIRSDSLHSGPENGPLAEN